MQTQECDRCHRGGHRTAQHCDDCGVVVIGQARLEFYADWLCVDWVLCASCEGKVNQS